MINYDELLNQWAEKIYQKADTYRDKGIYEESGSWKDGYYKGLAEAYIMAITELTMLEKKSKSTILKETNKPKRPKPFDLINNRGEVIN